MQIKNLEDMSVEELRKMVAELSEKLDKASKMCRTAEVMLCQEGLIRCNGDCIDCEMNDRAGKIMRSLRFGHSLGKS